MIENRKSYQSSHSFSLPFSSLSSTYEVFKFQLPFPGPSPTVMILHNTIIILVTIMGNLLLIGAVFRSNRVKRRKRVTPVQVQHISAFTETSYLCKSNLNFFRSWKCELGTERCDEMVKVLMLHLTTADILFALLTIFPNLVTIITHYEFHGPDSLCRFVKFLQVNLKIFKKIFD